ncbi:type I-B CRISPR-associated endonuclease Cas1b [Carboxydocella sp. ULO1]|uniref:type I-B CRISPR-associated endonuclease Cas1b n=1 Tax=Carboxydocella sp. ULO1 TaxID=1926599 RepID=UPI0009AE117E|nr:type I-B CRISPR-associated endonuclease Cas1b [Carboxydocella sp. ULO1]GAW29840.1 CRISPR-associated protein Cas1 [Carboxydocella sp. ULO1]
MKKTFYIFSNGELKRKENTIYFENNEGKKFIPVENTNEIYVFGEVNVNKKFLDFISSHQILLHYFNYHGYYSGTFYPREHYNSGYMILRQAEHYLDEEKRLYLARQFVLGAYRNIRQVLKYYENRGRAVGETLNAVEKLSLQIENCPDIPALMAIEGNMREHYYRAFDTIIGDDNFAFEQRTRRPPQNNLNTLISFGNSLLYTVVLSEIYKTHLDPRIGFLHATNFRRFSLNLDVAEIFKPIIVDRVIFNLLSKKMITPSDFDKETNGIVLKDRGKKAFVEEFDSKLKTTIKHRKLNREVSYRRLIRLELYKLEKHLMGEEEYTPFVSHW